jgi:hypothetical protein
VGGYYGHRFERADLNLYTNPYYHIHAYDYIDSYLYGDAYGYAAITVHRLLKRKKGLVREIRPFSRHR